MLNTLVSFSFQLLCFLPVLAICWIIHRKVDCKLIGVAIAIMFSDVLIVALTRNVPVLHFEGQNWNWFGKGAEIIFGTVIFGFLPVSWKKFASKWEPKRLVAVFLILIGGGVFVGLMNPPEAFSAQTLLFQLTMPSISEEVVYRGVLFAVFVKAFAGSRAILISAILVTAWFGIIHGIGMLNGAIQFDLVSLIVTSIVGGLLVILRVSARSLIYPILGHSIYNVLIQAVSVLRE